MTPSFFKLTMVSCGSKGWILTHTTRFPVWSLLGDSRNIRESAQSALKSVYVAPKSCFWSSGKRTRGLSPVRPLIKQKSRMMSFSALHTYLTGFDLRYISAVATSGNTYRQGLSVLSGSHIIWVHHFLIVWMGYTNVNKCLQMFTNVYKCIQMIQIHTDTPNKAVLKTRNVIPLYHNGL